MSGLGTTNAVCCSATRGLKLGLALGALAWGAPAVAACPTSTGAPDLDTALSFGERAYELLDIDGFGGAMDEAALILPCLDEPLPVDLAARYHRDIAVRLFTLRAEGKAHEALVAARKVAPDATFPETMLPVGHQILKSLAAVDPTDTERQPVAPPAVGELFFDGLIRPDRPTDRATILQLTDASGTVTTTAYLFVGDPLPDYAVSEVVQPEPVLVPVEPERTRRLNTGQTMLLIGSGAAAGTAIALYTSAGLSKIRFEDPHSGLERGELIELRTSANNRVIASAIVGGVAALGGVGFAVAGQW